MPWWAAACAVLLIACTGAWAQSVIAPTFSSQNVGTTSAPVSVSVTAPAGGLVANVAVLTVGAPNLDFQAASGGSCASASLASNQSCSQPVTFTPEYPGLRTGAVVLLASDGTVIGMTYLSGTGMGGLPVVVAGNMVPVAGSGAYDGQSGDGGPAGSADLDQPSSMVLDGAGNLYIADSIHNRIRMVSSGNGATIQGSVTYPAAGNITTIAGNGSSADGPDGVPAYLASLDTPSGVAIDGAGNLYIADTKNNKVRMIRASTGIITTVAGGGAAVSGNVGDGGVATSANLNQPWGVTVDTAGNLFIADTFNHRIRRVDVNTGIITTIAGTGTPGVGTGNVGDGGAATLAQLNRPYAVAFDKFGNMYIPDCGDNRIRKVDASGNITTFAGTGAIGFSADGTLAASALMWSPSGIVIDVAQNVYISDKQNNAIRKVSASTGKISTVVQTAKGKNAFQGVLFTNNLYAPVGLTLDGNGNLYVADSLYMRIRQVQSNVGLLDFTANAVRSGEVSIFPSTPSSMVIENDGNASLTLASVNAQSNALVKTASTTCGAGTLGVLATCTVVGQFAPTQSANPLFGAIDVNHSTSNSPVEAELVGDAIPANATTAILTSNPDPSNYGQSVSVTATLTTGAGTGSLTGTVTFMDGTSTLQSAVHVVASSIPNTYTASYATPALAVGVHTLTATYSGDSGHLATDPTMIPTTTQVVNEATTTSLTSNANPAALASSVTLTAKVTISGGGGVALDGTVNFTDGGVLIGSVAIDVNGNAALTTSSLTTGTHSITAAYLGDSGKNILGSTSGAFRQDVQAASTTVVTSSANPSTYGTSVSFIATVTSSGAVAPTGTVTFLDGATQIGTATLAGTSGIATFTTSSLTAGTHAISANYPGDSNSGPGTSAPIVQLINLTATSTGLGANPNPGIAGKAVVLTASVKPVAGSAAITGIVTFTDGATTLGTAKVGSGVASIRSILAPGPHAIVAAYSGDANDTSSASTAMPLAVNLATTAVAISSSASPSTVLAAVTFTATVTGNGGVPTGTVTFMADGASAGKATLSVNGTATFSDSSLTVGSHNITASYSGDSDDAASASSSLTQPVQAINTSTSLGSSTTSGTTPQLFLVATIAGNSGPVPTGTVTFTNGSQVIGAATLDESGVGTFIPDLAPSNYSIVANYGGDSVHAPSSSAAIKVTGSPTGFGITVTPPTLTLQTSQNATITINVSSNNGFTDTVDLGCGELPSGVNCHFSSNSVDLKAGASQSIQLTVDTNSPLNGGTTAMNSAPGGNPSQAARRFSLAGLYTPAALFFGFVLWRFRKRHAVAFMVMLALFLSGAFLITGCSGFSQSTAAPGTYTIQVTGVGSASNITHYQNITLTITK